MKPTPTEAFNASYVRPHEGRTLIVGSRIYDGREDRRKRYADAVGVDMLEGPGVDRVLNLEEPPPEDLGKFAHIECWSVLEHSRRPWLLTAGLERMLEKGGTLHVTVPWVWRFHAYPDDFFRFSPEGLKALFSGIDWKAVCLASNKLRPDSYLKAEDIKGHPYLPRCEVLAFGVRR